MKTIRQKLLAPITLGAFLYFVNHVSAPLHADSPIPTAQIDQGLSTFDSLVKAGAQGGELRMTTVQGLGGTQFQAADLLISKTYKLALAEQMETTDPMEFKKVVAKFLLFKVRTQSPSTYDALLKEVLSDFDGKLPNEPILDYIFGLALFREAEEIKGPKLYAESLDYINAALSDNPNFPEAHWIHSQILAYQRNQIPAVQQDFASIQKNRDNFSPELFLYDMDLISMIQNAAKL